MILDKMEQGDECGEALNLGDLKEALLAHICYENKAFFKSQQIDEPELNYDERKDIAEEILDKSHVKFLQRFGTNLKKQHLKFFESHNYGPEEQLEVNENLKQITFNLDHHGSIVRNRRYVKLLELIKEKKYFSEAEMKCRDPLLYEQLIGQFQSPAEKKANRRPDPTTDTLVDVLLEGIDFDHNREIESRQREEEDGMMENDEDESQQSSRLESLDDDEDSNESHKHWGNFDEPQPTTSTSQPKAKKRPAKLVTAGERDLLKEEFLGIMYSNFLSGKDSEFDYSTVDTNEKYDDTLETEQDCEDKYFDEDSEESPPANITNDVSSEDELDIYMKHLEKHLKQEEFEEEFDD
jgi:Coiled-coil domain containing protein (DUF2052)